MKVILQYFLIIIVTIFGLLFVIAVYGLFKTNQAKSSSNSFCEEIKVGDQYIVHESRAKLQNVSIRQKKDTGETLFIFEGFIFNSGVCAVTISDNNITKKRSYLYELN